jgi:hypothetical protein
MAVALLGLVHICDKLLVSTTITILEEEELLTYSVEDEGRQVR